MPAPSTIADFLDVVRKSRQIDDAALDGYLRRSPEAKARSPRKLAVQLIRAGVLTSFQAEQFLLGKHKGFRLDVYRILDRLGMGGSGLVYLGEHEVIKKRVAIKVLPPICAEDPVVLERFHREARAAAVLDHPNIVRVHDLRQEGSMHYIVMEYVEGPTLHQLLHRRKRLAIGTACEYARQAALGLYHAHSLGLVHRDIKPANLIVDPTGTIKILDLGLARYEADSEEESLTQDFNSNQILGTADYLAPEQALNLHNVDGRADIYSLGATLYALLTGQPPFPVGSIAKKLMLHQSTDPTPIHELLPEIPEELSGLVARMLAKKPDDRFASALEVAAVLAPWSEPPSRTALQSADRALTDLRIDPLTGMLSSTTGIIGRTGRLAPDTVMAAEEDTLSLDGGHKKRNARPLPPQADTPIPALPKKSGSTTPPVQIGRKRSTLRLTLIGLGIGLLAGLTVGLVGMLLAGG